MTKSPEPDRAPSRPRGEFEHLRLRAEHALGEPAARPDIAGPSATLIRELRLHQVELELQNEELQSTGESLEQSLERYRNLYDRAPVGYLTLSTRSVIEESNLTAVELLGVDRASLQGRPLASLLDRESADRLHVHLGQVFESGRGTCELPFRRGDGSSLDLRIESVAIDRDAEPRCLSAILDVSDRKIAKRQLLALTDDLERRVEDRTRELQEVNESLERDAREHRRVSEALAIARKMEALGRLAGGVAHDFNNQLQIMQLELELMRDEVILDSPMRQSVDSLSETVRSAAAVAGQLLAFCRRDKDAGAGLELRGELERMEPKLRRLAGEAVSLELSVADGEWWIRLDRASLEQIMINLVNNAVAAIAAKGGRLAIGVRAGVLDADSAVGRGPDGAPGVVITVRDGGSGMSAATRERLFEPFFTTRRGDGGTGLGLATVYGIITNAGGHVAVESAVGVGSEFTIWLPRSERPAEAPPKAAPEPARVRSRREESVLLVEDRASVRGVLGAALRSSGYRVVAAESGERARAILEADHQAVDLVLTDVAMPGMSGVELAAIAAERWPTIPVVLMSGNVEFHPTDGVRFLQKPFSLAALTTEIRDALGGTGATGS